MLRVVSSAVIILFRWWMRRTYLSWRCDVPRSLPLRVLLFFLSVYRRPITNLEMVILDTLKWSATAWTITTAISRSFWRTRAINVLVKILILRMSNWLPLLTAQLMPNSIIANSIMGRQFTFRNYFVTKYDVIVCFVRIDVFHANIDVNDNKQLLWF